MTLLKLSLRLITSLVENCTCITHPAKEANFTSQDVGMFVHTFDYTSICISMKGATCLCRLIKFRGRLETEKATFTTSF